MRAVGGLIALAALCAAGCGGGTETETVVQERTVTEVRTAEPETSTDASAEAAARARLAERAGRICSRARTASNRARGALGFEPGQTQAESGEQLARLSLRENEVRRQRRRDLAALDVPDSLRPRFELYLESLDREIVVVNGLATAATDGDRARISELVRQIRQRVRRNRKLALAAGLGRCGA